MTGLGLGDGGRLGKATNRLLDVVQLGRMVVELDPQLVDDEAIGGRQLEGCTSVAATDREQVEAIGVVVAQDSTDAIADRGDAPQKEERESREGACETDSRTSGSAARGSVLDLRRGIEGILPQPVWRQELA